jgi:hypothetical protein
MAQCLRISTIGGEYSVIFSKQKGESMNWSLIIAGLASINGLFFAFATWSVLVWRNAAEIPLDRWLPPIVGTIWGAVICAPGNSYLGTRRGYKKTNQTYLKF